MKMHEINSDKESVVMLLHPMLATSMMMHMLLVSRMSDQHRYIIPDFSGHGDAVEETYISAYEEARALHDYLIKNDVHDIQMAYGASMGAVVLMELLRYSDITIHQLFFEGASMFEHAGCLNAIIKRMMLLKRHKARAHPERVAPKLATLYGEEAKGIMAKQMLSISKESLKNIVTDCSHVHLANLTLEQQKNTVFAYGEKDANRKKATQICASRYPHAKLKIWPNEGHCTYVTSSPDEYAQILENFISK